MKTIAYFLIFSILFSVPFSASADGGAFLVMDGTVKIVLEEENGDARLPMASTTKVMTALVVLENAALDEQITIPAEAVGVEGSSLYVKTGEIYTVEELLYALMLQSANDCAVALAWHVGGKSVENFVGMMNQKAVALGLQNTHYANPNGLSAEGHYTTARELAVVMFEAMKNKVFREITGTKRYTIKEHTVVNHNKLLSLYQGCVGGKTGYTMEAGRCLVSVAERKGASLICVTLGRRDDWNIHSNAFEKWFSALEKVTFMEEGAFKTRLSLAGGGDVWVKNSNRVIAEIINYDGTLETKVLAERFVYGNKQVGAVVGTLEFWYHGVRMGESPLVLMEPVDVPVKKELFISGIFRFFRRLFLKKV